MKKIVIKKDEVTNEIIDKLLDAWFIKTDPIECVICGDVVVFSQKTPYICAYCGRRDNSVVIHHIIGRRYKSLVNYVYNLIPLCYEHHVASSSFSAHATPKKFWEWFTRKYPVRSRLLRKKLKFLKGLGFYGGIKKQTNKKKEKVEDGKKDVSCVLVN